MSILAVSSGKDDSLCRQPINVGTVDIFCPVSTQLRAQIVYSNK